jgi:hypothetical protein
MCTISSKFEELVEKSHFTWAQKPLSTLS